MKYSLLLSFSLFFFQNLSAQDAGFSQFYNDRTLLNPALTGLDEGFSLAGQFREQWYVNWPNRFQTMSTCIECQIDKSGVGFAFHALKDREGGGALSTLNLGGSLAKIVQTGDNSALHLGLIGSYAEKFLDYDKLIFSDQITAFSTELDGNLDNLPASMAERTGKSRFASVGGGVVYRGELPFFKTGSFNKNPFFSFGTAVHHTRFLVRPEESLLGDNSVVLPLRWTIHTGITVPFPKDWVGSKVRYWNYTFLGRAHFQGHLTSFAVGLNSAFNDWGVSLMAFRGRKFFSSANANAFVFALSREWGVKKDGQIFKVEASYDIPTGHVGTQTGGVFELSMRLRFANACKFSSNSKPGKPDKPRWFGKGKVKCPRPNNGPPNRLH